MINVAAIRLSTFVGEDRRLVVDLPANTPTGPVEVIINPKPELQKSGNSAREMARAKLLAANFLVTQIDVPESAIALTLQERMKLGQLPAGARSSEDLIDEDRGAW